MIGDIEAITEKHTLFRDIAYMRGQLFERVVESGYGAITCLPGSLTILRFSSFCKLGKPRKIE